MSFLSHFSSSLFFYSGSIINHDICDSIVVMCKWDVKWKAKLETAYVQLVVWSSTISCSPVSVRRDYYRHNRTISLGSSCDEGLLMVGRSQVKSSQEEHTKIWPSFQIMWSWFIHGADSETPKIHVSTTQLLVSFRQQEQLCLILACFFSLGKHLQRFKAEILSGQTCLKYPTQFPYNGCETGTFNWWYEPWIQNHKRINGQVKSYIAIASFGRI